LTEHIGITNFFVALVFLPLRNFLSGGEASKEGRIFFIFAAAFSGVFLWFMRLYK
jgi:MFS transporter, SP family, solute carrier family 2 (facilitated glucose transporter), member 3